MFVCTTKRKKFEYFETK